MNGLSRQRVMEEKNLYYLEMADSYLKKCICDLELCSKCLFRTEVSSCLRIFSPYKSDAMTSGGSLLRKAFESSYDDTERTIAHDCGYNALIEEIHRLIQPYPAYQNQYRVNEHFLHRLMEQLNYL